MQMKTIAAAALAGTALLAAAPAGAGSTQRKTAKVADYSISPSRLTVNAGSLVTWRWPYTGGDTHDVKLVRAPRGVKKWQSDLASESFNYRKRLKVPGKYTVICSLHPDDMRQTITVRR